MIGLLNLYWRQWTGGASFPHPPPSGGTAGTANYAVIGKGVSHAVRYLSKHVTRIGG